jgi:Sulfatase
MTTTTPQSDGSAPADPVRRDNLPIPDVKHVGLTTYDARDPNTPITMLRPPAGAPNVLIVLIDDVGFGASSAFGGPCNTPVAERLSANGLKLNRFHTTALCRLLGGPQGWFWRSWGSRYFRRRRCMPMALISRKNMFVEVIMGITPRNVLSEG